MFTAEIERSISINPNDYYKNENNHELQNANIFNVVSGKTGSIDFIAKKVLIFFIVLNNFFL